MNFYDLVYSVITVAIFRYGISVFLVIMIIRNQRKKEIKKTTLFVSILVVDIIANVFFSRYGTPDAWFWPYSLAIQAIKIAMIFFGVHIVILIKAKQYAKLLLYIFPFILVSTYYDIVLERSLILGKLRHRFFQLDPIDPFLREHHQYPVHIEELDQVLLKTQLDDIYRLRSREKILYWNPGLVKKPDFSVKTWIDDTTVYCQMYAFGFDNDDDKLNKEIENPIFRPSSYIYGIPLIILYLLSPVALDGDIGHPPQYSSSIFDPELDTNFVRQIWELQGDTLTTEEYYKWLEKRDLYLKNDVPFDL